jgi:hypothetical protein
MFAPTPVKLGRVTALLSGHMKALREGGIISLPSVIKDIAVKVRRAFISKDKYYLYEKDLIAVNNLQIIHPHVDGVTMDIIFLPISIEEYELLGEKRFDFRKHPKVTKFGPSVGDGTIIFLGVIGEDIIYRSCISNYRNGVYRQIYPEKFDSKSTCYQGYNWTSPIYRKKGLYSWAQTVMFNFMRANSYHKIIMLEPEDQIGPRKVQERLGSEMLCESFAFRLFFIVNYRWNKPAL